MARQRFIHPELWTDPTVGQLPPLERLLFIGCFSNADDEGRLLGNPAYLRSTVFPYDDFTIDQVREMRDHVIEHCKNIILYEADGLEYLAFTKWERYQKPKYAKSSKLPVPPEKNNGESFLQNGGKDGEHLPEDLLPRLGRVGLGLDLDRVGLGRDEIPPPTPDDDQLFIAELKQILAYPFDEQKDSENLKQLRADFPTLNLLSEVKAWRTYKRDKPLKKDSNPRLQFRKWCQISLEKLEKEAQAHETHVGTDTRPAAGSAQSKYPMHFETGDTS